MRFRLKSLFVLVTITALSMAVYFRSPNRLEDVSRVEIKTKKSDVSYRFRFEPDVNRRSLRHVLRLLPIGGQIDFSTTL